jgi:hypothetical protein
MAFQKKYYYSFKDLNEQEYTIEIWQDTTSTISAVEVLGGVEPFSIEYAQLDNKITPIHGSGTNINLMATATHNFIDLYTGRIQEFMVKCYKGTSLIWCGYLDSEMYSSDFSMIENYPVSFTASDGFAILDRMLYITPSNLVLSDDGYAMIETGLMPYTGISTQWTVITNILDKLNLPYNDIRVGLSTTSSDFTIGEYETIFHKTFVINNNYVNETKEPETCRKVLEGILAPYGAFIIQINGSIYITDLNYIADNIYNKPFEGFNPTFYNGLGVAYVNLILGDLSDIGFKSDSSTLAMMSPINKMIVNYSNYRDLNIIDYSQTDFTITGTTSGTIGNTGYQWKETTYLNSDTWNKFHNGRFIYLQGVTNPNNTDTYLSINSYSNNNGYSGGEMSEDVKSFTYKKELPYLIPTTDYFLQIEMSAFFRTSDNIDDIAAIPSVMEQGVLGCRLESGGKRAYNYRYYVENKYAFNDGSRLIGWRDSGSNITVPSTNFKSDFYLYFNKLKGVDGTIMNNLKYDSIENTWVELNDNKLNASDNVENKKFLFPLNGMVGDYITFSIYDYFVLDQSHSATSNALKASTKEVRIKDIKISIVDKDGNNIEKADTEYFSNMMPEYKDEQKVDLIHGTNVDKCPTERAGLLYSGATQFDFCTTWTREGNTNILEKLLQNSVKSNYLLPTVQLNCTINSIPNLLGCLTYQNWIPDKIFSLMGAKINLEDASTEITISEISKDVWNIL